MTDSFPLRKLTLAHSPDSDDAFMFWALKHKLVPSDNLEFEHYLADIQTLNQYALEGRYDITAISIHAYAYAANQYYLMDTGASMGDGYGPVLVGAKPLSLDDLARKTIAIPGALTTANLLLKIAVPGVRVEEMRFDHIMNAVRNNLVDAGLLIHEGQVSYSDEGLHLIADLGAWWKKETGLPVPLGANAIKRELGSDIISSAVSAIRASVKYGLANRHDALAFASKYSHNLNYSRLEKFVSMYVNDYTLSWGEIGKEAVLTLLKVGAEAGIVPHIDSLDFVS